MKSNIIARVDRGLPVYMPKEYSMLGCHNNRETNIRKMAKVTALRLAEVAQKKE